MEFRKRFNRIWKNSIGPIIAKFKISDLISFPHFLSWDVVPCLKQKASPLTSEEVLLVIKDGCWSVWLTKRSRVQLDASHLALSRAVPASFTALVLSARAASRSFHWADFSWGGTWKTMTQPIISVRAQVVLVQCLVARSRGVDYH